MLATGFLMEAHAEPISIAITAEVASVDDQGGVLAGAVNVGDVITGTYVYESTTLDTNTFVNGRRLPAHNYPFWHHLKRRWFFFFRTDPNNVDFLVEIVDDHVNTSI